MNTSLQFLDTLIENFKKNIINDNILLLVFKDINYSNKIIDTKQLKKVFFEDMSDEYYQLFNMNELDNLDELENDQGKKNLIVLGYKGMNIDKIANTNFEILLFFNPVQPIIKFKTFDNLLTINHIRNPYTKFKLITKRNPLKIIYSNDFINIYSFLTDLFLPNIFNETFILFHSIDILKSDRSTYHYLNYSNTLENDIHLLIQEKKLTARLAIAIYKVATLRFYDNNTIIGTFYRTKLGIKSKSYSLEKKTYPPKIIKVYDLNNKNC